MSETSSLIPFLNNTDDIGRLVLCALFLLSFASWYVIVQRLWHRRQQAPHSSRFRQELQAAATPQALAANLDRHPPREPLGRLAGEALDAVRQLRQRSGTALCDTGPSEEFVAAALRRALLEESTRAEYGLSLLATIAATAPFIGLFGTVWGIYHALVAISLSGQGSLDKVAGPIGEALIMTACGLAVAIPAVLAYNAFVRELRVRQCIWESFAHDLLAFLGTGILAERQAAPGVDDRRPLYSMMEGR